MKNLFRTVLALLFSFIMWMVAGLLFNSLSALFCILMALSYYCFALFLYFTVAGDDKISNRIGIFVSVSFFILNILFVLDARTDWFVKICFVTGALSGIGLTPSFIIHKNKEVSHERILP